MRVKLRTNLASPTRSAPAGSVIDLPEAEARELIDGKFAVAVERERFEATAMRSSDKEQAVQRRPSLRGK